MFFYNNKKIGVFIPRRIFTHKRIKPEHFVNNNIPFSSFFVLDVDGSKLGVMKKQNALDLAKDKEMDLVIVSKNNSKPVAKILDYGKFKYERKKKNKILKQKQTIINNREIRLTPMIGEHDLITKSKKARVFLLNGDRVKVSLKFRGREIIRKELGYEKLDYFYNTLKDICEVQKPPKLMNRRFLDMYLQKSKKSNKTKEKEIDNESKIKDKKSISKEN